MKKLFFLFLCISVLSFSGFAQKFKYGYVNGTLIFGQMQEKQKADTALAVFVNELENEVKRMQDEYMTKANAYKDQEAEMSELIKQSKADELNGLNKRIQDFQVSAQKEIQKKQQELYTPVRKHFDEALTKVAKNGGYKFIIDNSQGVLLYYEEGDNVDALLKKELGIK